MSRLIDADELIEEIKSHRMVITGMRYGKSALNEYVKCFVESILKIIDEQPTVGEWIPCSERMPEDDKYILMSFENYSLPLVGRYDKNGEMGGAFYIGDCDEDDTCIANNLFVNAWQPLPESYREESE